MMRTEKSSLSWHVVYTMPHAEMKMYKALSKQNVKAFLPTTTMLVQWSDRRKKVTRPLFPNYVFVSVSSTQELSRIYPLDGFVRFLSTNGRIDSISQGEINAIEQLLTATPQVEKYTFEPGEEVEVVDGPFKGLRGTYVKKGGSNKFFVRIQSLNLSLGVEISPYQLAPSEVV